MPLLTTRANRLEHVYHSCIKALHLKRSPVRKGAVRRQHL